MVEWTISIGNLLTTLLSLGGFIFATFGFFYALRRSIDMTGERILLLSGRMINVENELKELQKVLVAMAVQDEKMVQFERQIVDYRKSSDDFCTWVRNEISKLRETR